MRLKCNYALQDKTTTEMTKEVFEVEEFGLPGFHNVRNEKLKGPVVKSRTGRKRLPGFEGVSLHRIELNFYLEKIEQIIAEENLEHLSFLEVGAGASTIYLNQFFNKLKDEKVLKSYKLFSIENDPYWYDAIDNYLDENVTMLRSYAEYLSVKSSNVNIVMLDSDANTRCKLLNQYENLIKKQNRGKIIHMFIHDFNIGEKGLPWGYDMYESYVKSIFLNEKIKYAELCDTLLYFKLECF